MLSNIISIILGNAPPEIPLTLKFLNMLGALEQWCHLCSWQLQFLGDESLIGSPQAVTIKREAYLGRL